MSIIKLPLHFEGSKANATRCTLFDGEANLSCISDVFAAQLTELIPFLTPRLDGTAAEGHN